MTNMRTELKTLLDDVSPEINDVVGNAFSMQAAYLSLREALRHETKPNGIQREFETLVDSLKNAAIHYNTDHIEKLRSAFETNTDENN